MSKEIAMGWLERNLSLRGVMRNSTRFGKEGLKWSYRILDKGAKSGIGVFLKKDLIDTSVGTATIGGGAFLGAAYGIEQLDLSNEQQALMTGAASILIPAGYVVHKNLRKIKDVTPIIKTRYGLGNWLRTGAFCAALYAAPHSPQAIEYANMHLNLEPETFNSLTNISNQVTKVKNVADDTINMTENLISRLKGETLEERVQKQNIDLSQNVFASKFGMGDEVKEHLRRLWWGKIDETDDDKERRRRFLEDRVLTGDYITSIGGVENFKEEIKDSISYVNTYLDWNQFATYYGLNDDELSAVKTAALEIINPSTIMTIYATEIANHDPQGFIEWVANAPGGRMLLASYPSQGDKLFSYGGPQMTDIGLKEAMKVISFLKFENESHTMEDMPFEMMHRATYALALANLGRLVNENSHLSTLEAKLNDSVTLAQILGVSHNSPKNVRDDGDTSRNGTYANRMKKNLNLVEKAFGEEVIEPPLIVQIRRPDEKPPVPAIPVDTVQSHCAWGPYQLKKGEGPYAAIRNFNKEGGQRAQLSNVYLDSECVEPLNPKGTYNVGDSFYIGNIGPILARN